MKWENQTEQTMSYQADQFGLYLALAVHANIQVDFVDEDAALNATLLDEYLLRSMSVFCFNLPLLFRQLMVHK